MGVQFDIGYHSELTTEANDGVLDTTQLAYVVAANIAQDLLQTQSKVHFDNCDFPGGIDHLAAEWAVIDTVGDKYADSALGAFGALLHTTQDFYAHSNWIELHQDQSPVPVWDQTLASLPEAIVSGTWWIGSPKLCGPNAPTHSQLNKDSPKSAEGGKIVDSGPNKGKTLFELAYATALEASKRQYARFKAVGIEGAGLVRATGGAALEEIIASNQRLRDTY